MVTNNKAFIAVCAVIAIALTKIAFWGSSSQTVSLVPSAYAEGGIIEWNDAKRIVTASADGATTYVWDYEHRTKVRKYQIIDDKLELSVYEIAKEPEKRKK